MSAHAEELFSLTRGSGFLTGAAGGIGRELAIGLARLGMAVACADRPGTALDEVVAEVEAVGGKATAVEFDATDETSIEDAVDTAVRTLGPLAYAINCAGINIQGPALDVDVETWRRVIDVNATGVFLCSRVQARRMRLSGGGSIVNIASMSATIVNRRQDQAPYYASKAAVRHVSKSLAAELAPDNIRVNCVSPGYTRTPLLRQPVEVIERFCDDTPMGRLAEPHEMVGPTAFLLSDAASFVTGHDLLVDGGYTVW